MSEPTVLFETVGAVGRITLNRPKGLNALTLEQVRQIDPAMRRWAEEPAIACVVIQGVGEKAFCAGGDIRALYDASVAGDRAFLEAFFGEEYRLNRLIHTYPKPYVALIDGITMGGGVGLSVHGPFRVATERTVFAMPETGIGFFPDVGGTHFLPRCPGRTGLYLGLTGARLRTADAHHVGVSTHVVPAAGLDALVGELAELRSADHAAAKAVLDRHHRAPDAAPIAGRQAVIDRLFAGDTLHDVMAALQASDDPWAADTLAALRTKSPWAMAVTFQQLRRGAGLSFDEAMRLEYRMAPRGALHPDFREGVRAVIVDKDNAPRWQHASVEAVGAAEVDDLFAPADKELSFA